MLKNDEVEPFVEPDDNENSEVYAIIIYYYKLQNKNKKWDKIYFSLNLMQCQKSLMSTCIILILKTNYTNKYVHVNYLLLFLLWLEYNKSWTLLRL